MSNNSDSLTSLLKQLSLPKVGGVGISQLLSPGNSLSQSQSASSAKPPSLGDTKTSSIGVKDTATGIQFGSPSNSRTPASQSSMSVSSLLTQAASGGVSSALSGGLGIAGLGGLVTGLLGLFGGSKTALPPLVRFELPTTQQATVYTSRTGNTTYDGTSVVQTNPPASQTGIYATGNNSGSLQYQSSDVAQAVKTALLNSSSLNDVIAEI